jgi:hypothetical protein
MEMNEVYRGASEWVQRGTFRVASMIKEPGLPAGHLQISV